MTYYTKRQEIKANCPPDKHLPNKNEAKMLRKIMAETGLNELEVRNIKKYRKMLSEAQDAGETELTWDEKGNKYRNSIYKMLTREFKLPREHPIIEQKYKTYLFENRHRLPIYLFYS